MKLVNITAPDMKNLDPHSWRYNEKETDLPLTMVTVEDRDYVPSNVKTDIISFPDLVEKVHVEGPCMLRKRGWAVQVAIAGLALLVVLSAVFVPGVMDTLNQNGNLVMTILGFVFSSFIATVIINSGIENDFLNGCYRGHKYTNWTTNVNKAFSLVMIAQEEWESVRVPVYHWGYHNTSDATAQRYYPVNDTELYNLMQEYFNKFEPINDDLVERSAEILSHIAEYAQSLQKLKTAKNVKSPAALSEMEDEITRSEERLSFELSVIKNQVKDELETIEYLTLEREKARIKALLD